MQIDSSTPKTLATIAGVTVNVPQPFTEGYQLTANEAAAMNQLLTENLRNNIAGRAKKAKDENKTFDMQAELDAYAASYQFGARSVGFRATDPVEREMQSMARKKIEEALKAKGIKLKTVADDQWTSLIGQYIDAHGDALRSAANAKIKAEADLAAALLPA